ncbi:phosphotransferase [Paenibacillus sp. JDR-2]|uniref:phosphotransferase n=1 Tax=Paenibacillus sp. (strain JDR-2) TaxID=324057 RepID=UPI00016681CD|nr:phosphotransferase [Paenibacillus sp. JDR-2]ACT01323.1 aminoglycoside phosphotransferase [Paenibacillus sp. JDR-2]
MKDIELAALIEQYPFDGKWTVVPGDSGMNNTTRMIKAGDDRYVLRVYNNHRDTNIVSLEHHVLFALYRQQPGFKVPIPVENRSGDTITVASSGALAALYRYIPGERPTVQQKAHIRSLGETAARVSKALRGMKISNKPIYDPYYLLEETYSSLIHHELPAILQSSEQFLSKADKAAAILNQVKDLSGALQAVKELPHQWIHGDLNFSNTVAEGEFIIGVLDFEFCTVDVRAMELVVAQIDFFKGGDSEIWERLRLFCEGYGSIDKLTPEEVEVLPLLIKLRMLDVFLHFAGRYNEGLDDAGLVAGFIDQTYQICEWVDRSEEQLLALFRHQLL